jgi:Domain of unknown function (DUF4132)
MTYSERLERIEVFRTGAYSVAQWHPAIGKIADEMIAYILDETKPLPKTTMTGWGFSQIGKLMYILELPKDWDEYDERILEIIAIPQYWHNPSASSSYDGYFESHFFENYVNNMLSYYANDSFDILFKTKKKLGLDESQFLQSMINYVDAKSWYISETKLSDFGHFILVKAQEDLPKLLTFFNKDNDFALFNLLLFHDKTFTDDKFGNFLTIRKGEDSLNELSFFVAESLLKKNAERYEKLITDLIPQITQPANLANTLFLLRKHLPAKYASKLEEHCTMFLKCLKPMMIKQGIGFYPNQYIYSEFAPNYEGGGIQLYYSVGVLAKSTDSRAFDVVVDIFENCLPFNIKVMILSEVFPIYKERFFPIVFAEKNQPKTNDYYADWYYRTFFKTLITTNFEEYQPQVWDFTKNKSKKIRELAAVALSKLGEKSILNAEKLLSEKKADARQTGALILSLIRTDKSQEILMNAIDSEKDDNTRDTMLEGVAGLLPTVFSQEEITQKVQKAKERGKLEKPLEWWLDESKLPDVYWENTNQVIDNETIRFLFYRMSRTKDIRTDIEAKPLIMSIDRTSSGSFAKALIKTYFDNGADAKYKFCLTLGGLFGDDEIIDLMKRKVNEFAEGSRGKMAEYTVKALALQGSTKALRAVEFFSRKYKNKNKNIGAAANESFGIVAEEFGITPYDLADSIIPNFDFDGLFREFEAGGESYRAFINTDFKIAYFNEDNKLMKSPPKAISKELAEEFKEISKEIRDIVKSQSGRLEQYLVIQRKWNAERWQEFFLGNPIMFAYAVRLIWGAYNAKGELQFVFRCEQDQTLIDENSEEIELSEDLFVGMVHPISLSSESIEYWSASLYDANIEAIFPQLKRPVVLLKDGDKNLRISEEFNGIKISGYTFVGKLEKMGWFRGSVVDGGGISSYYKDFSELSITAVVMQIGSIGVGYLEDNAEVGNLMFAKKGSVQFGSYMYDEPDKTTDSRLFTFGEVPPIVYSEVLADMMALKAIAITT